jgi:filamentous hemagglutinin
VKVIKSHTLSGLTRVFKDVTLEVDAPDDPDSDPAIVLTVAGTVEVAGTGSVTVGNGTDTVTLAGVTVTGAADTEFDGATGTATIAGTGSEITVTGTVVAAGTGSLVIGGSENNVTLTKATLTGGSGDGADGALTLDDDESIALATGGTIVVAGTGAVDVVTYLTLAEGTFTGQGTNGAKFDGATSAVIAGNGTSVASGDGLLIGTATAGVKLLSTGTAATATFAATVAKTTLGGSKVSVAAAPETLSTTSTQVFAVGATGSIVVGTTSGGVDVGNGGKLQLAAGAKIGVFTDVSSTSELVAGVGANGALAFTTTASGTITAGSGTLTVATGAVVLTGGASGTSIAVGSDIDASA